MGVSGNNHTNGNGVFRCFHVRDSSAYSLNIRHVIGLWSVIGILGLLRIIIIFAVMSRLQQIKLKQKEITHILAHLKWACAPFLRPGQCGDMEGG